MFSCNRTFIKEFFFRKVYIMVEANKKEVFRKLTNKLVATIGTHGSQRGCTLDTAFREFR